LGVFTAYAYYTRRNDFVPFLIHDDIEPSAFDPSTAKHQPPNPPNVYNFLKQRIGEFQESQKREDC
jgi:hypothetical protein